VGGIVFGLLSDRVFGGRRAPVVVIAFGAQALLLAAFGLAERAGAGAMTAACALLSISFFVNGAHGMVGGAASMDFGGRKAAATAAGLIDGVQYLIAGPLVGVGMGRLLDTYGWSVWQFAPLPFAPGDATPPADAGTKLAPLATLASIRELHRVHRRIAPDLVHHVALQATILGSLATLGRPVARVNAITGLGYAFIAETRKARIVRSTSTPAGTWPKSYAVTFASSASPMFVGDVRCATTAIGRSW